MTPQEIEEKNSMLLRKQHEIKSQRAQAMPKRAVNSFNEALALPQKKTDTRCRGCGGVTKNFDIYGDPIVCDKCVDEARAEREAREIRARLESCVPKKFLELETSKQEPLDRLWQKSLFLFGGVGTGKTVFACSVAKKIVRAGGRVDFKSYPALIMFLQNLYRQDGEGPFSFAEKIATSEECLILDDIGAEKITDFVKQITYYIVNEREQRCLQTVITSNFSLAQIDAMIDPRISSRIAGTYEILNFGNTDQRIKKRSK